jgi:hypothetical protein
MLKIRRRTNSAEASQSHRDARAGFKAAASVAVVVTIVLAAGSVLTPSGAASRRVVRAPTKTVTVTRTIRATKTVTATATATATVTATATATVTVPGPTQTATVTAMPTSSAAPTAPAPAAPIPKVASVMQDPGETWSAAVVRTLGYGYNGVVRYYPGAPSWDAQLSALAAAHPGPLFLQVTAKTHSDAALDAILTNAPRAWTVTYNIYQEPEDNLADAASQSAYRAAYTSAAKVTRAHGASLPWVEWQEWTLDPANSRGWNLANFTPPAGDFGGVLWSLFEYGEKAPPSDRLAAQVARIKDAMATYAPGKPWAIMAAGYTLESSDGTFTPAQYAAQAGWVSKSYAAVKAAGGTGWGWFNYHMDGSGGAAGESRLELNPTALAVLPTLS